MKPINKMLMRGMIGLVFGAGLVLGASTAVDAQGYDKRHARHDREHQRQQRYYRNDHTTRRGGYDNRFYGGRAVRSRGRAVYTGGYYYDDGHNRGRYNDRRRKSGYYGDGHHGRGYFSEHYGYGARYAPHHDSHNPVIRFLHHALGGH